MTSSDDYGLANILDTIGGVDCPEIVAAMLALRAQTFRGRGIDDSGR